MDLADRLIAPLPRPDAPALRTAAGGTLTRAELAAAVRRAARRLVDRGLRPGERLAVQAPKSLEGAVLYLATLYAGGVYLPLNPGYTAAETAFFLEDARPFARVDDPAAFLGPLDAGPELAEPAPRDPEDLAAIVYTSGTTGRSKGAMLSRRALLANGEAIARAWGLGSGDVLLHALPIFHVHGLFIALNSALLAGCEILWLDGFDAAETLRRLPQATVFMGVPTYYVRLLALPGLEAAAAGVRLFVSGSAPLSPETFEAFAARTGQRILERYGMSEAGVIASNPLEGARVPGSVGFALGDYRVRTAGGGAGPGEIEIAGESLFSGYWNLPERRAQDFTADGFFRTGDVGRLDAEGRLWISDRAKDLVITGGLNVYPREVELVLDALPGVRESAVIGVPHPDFGEAVVAVVAGAGEEAAIVAALRERLAAFKAPKRVVFVDELPRNAMGKVQKAALRTRLADLFAGRG